MQLVVNPQNIGISWKAFTKFEPPRSIALDGFVVEGPRFRPDGPWANFNHHAEVSRLETRATCAQVLLAIRQGLIDAMRGEDGTEGISIYVNDCDEDVCLSVFLLRYHAMALGALNPAINRLVFLEDMMDTTGGAYPFPTDQVALSEMLWIFAPYHSFRVSGQIDERKEADFRLVIDEVGRRILAHIAGRGGTLPPDVRFDALFEGKGWTMVREVGRNARLGVYGAGIKAFVSYRAVDDDRYVYSLGRSSQYIRFPIPKILAALNVQETKQWRGMLEAMPDDRWGGSDMIAGGPRTGSLLTPQMVKETINAAL